MAYEGQRVRYVAVAGDVWDAEVTAIHSSVSVDLDILNADGTVALRVTNVPRRMGWNHHAAWFVDEKKRPKK